MKSNNKEYALMVHALQLGFFFLRRERGRWEVGMEEG